MVTRQVVSKAEHMCCYQSRSTLSAPQSLLQLLRRSSTLLHPTFLQDSDRALLDHRRHPRCKSLPASEQNSAEFNLQNKSQQISFFRCALASFCNQRFSTLHLQPIVNSSGVCPMREDSQSNIFEAHSSFSPTWYSKLLNFFMSSSERSKSKRWVLSKMRLLVPDFGIALMPWLRSHLRSTCQNRSKLLNRLLGWSKCKLQSSHAASLWLLLHIPWRLCLHLGATGFVWQDQRGLEKSFCYLWGCLSKPICNFVHHWILCRHSSSRLLSWPDWGQWWVCCAVNSLHITA